MTFIYINKIGIAREILIILRFLGVLFSLMPGIYYPEFTDEGEAGDGVSKLPLAAIFFEKSIADL